MSASTPKVTKEEIWVATAALLGGHPVYDDFGHPERATARKYWIIYHEGGKHYGSTRSGCARGWLKRWHPDVKIP